MKTKSLLLSLAALAVLPGMAFAQSFLVDPSNTSNHTVEVAAGGNVGIGIADPQAKLHVAGAVRASAFEGIGPVTFRTIDNQPLEFIVNGQRALRLEPAFAPSSGESSANVIGGFSGNSISAGVLGGTIAGGGSTGNVNTVVGGYGTIGGGYGNIVDGFVCIVGGGRQNIIQYNRYATISGGVANTIQPGDYSTISGGFGNTIQTGAIKSTIAGGYTNSIGNGAAGSVISGGELNSILPGADHSTIPGGTRNSIGSSVCFAAGYRAGALHPGSFVWADSTDADFASSASNQFLIRASGGVGIGTNNPTAKLEVAGTIKCQVVDLSGADLAEKFDVAGEFVPGMVVCPDPENEGKLHVCAREYDRSAIGVLSGAGGINTGLVLHQPGTAAEGEQPVAMTGRVYVWADASLGAIKPGDELTSSATRGHAMKATDDTRANRAVLGTALTNLKEGRGLVLTALQRR